MGEGRKRGGEKHAVGERESGRGGEERGREGTCAAG